MSAKGFTWHRLRDHLVPFVAGLGVIAALNATIAYKLFGSWALVYTALGPLAHPLFRGYLFGNALQVLMFLIFVVLPVYFLMDTFSRDGERRPFIAGIVWGVSGGMVSGIYGLAAQAVRAANG